MKKLAKLMAIITMVVIIALVGVNSLSFAYFYTSNKQINDSGSANFADKNLDAKVRKVSTLKELYFSTQDTNVNSNAQMSAIKDRFTILLTADISLVRDLTVTADCNIDLGGNTLFIGGYQLGYYHSYKGSLLIYNGNIVGDVGSKILINTPNAMVDLSNANISQNVDTQVVGVSQDQILAKAIEMADYAIIGKSAVTANNRECLRHTDANHLCAYVCMDLDLPFNLYGYNAQFNYTTDNASALTATGKINGAVGNVVDVNLNLTITFGEQTIAKSYVLHVYSSQDSIAKETASLVAVADSLDKYFYHGALTGGGEIVSVYKIYQSTYLPRYINGLQIDYQTLTQDGAQRDSTLNINGNNFEMVGVNGYAINLDEQTTALKISVGAGGNLTLPVNGSDVSSIVDNYTIALKIAQELYGEEIIIKNEEGHNGFTKVAVQDDMTKYLAKGVIGVEYLMSYDIDKTYRIGALDNQSGRFLYVADPVNPPTILQKSGLRIRFSFNSEPNMVSLTVPIRYVQDDITEGNMIAKFWPYYNYFNRLFAINSGKYGINTFTMPFNYEDKVVYYYEALSAGAVTDVVSMSLQYYLGEQVYTATVEQVKSMTPLEITQIVKTNKANWIISFNPDKLTVDDIDLQFKYMYKFNDFTTTWYGRETDEYISLHTAAGIIKDKAITGLSDYIADANLYAYVYNNSKPSNVANYAPNSGKYIHTIWLNDDFAEISNVNNALNINNYDGIQLLKNVKKLNLSGALAKSSSVDQGVTQYIAGMASLIELDLSNNGEKFSDRKKGLINLPSGSNNNAIRRLSALTKLEKLHLEGNWIYYFEDLRYIPNLKEVCVYNNVIMINLLNIDTLFGTKGVVNYSVFTSLSGKGVKVNNTGEGSGYTGTTESHKVVDAISALVYQKVIGKNASITEAYSSLSTDWRDYLTAKMTQPIKHWLMGTVDKDDEVRFVYEGDATTTNTFRLEYKYYYFVSQIFSYDTYEIVIDFEFEVIRV